MMRIGSEALAEVEAALKAYEQAVEEAPLAPSSRQTYVNRAQLFVRWLKGDFEPGAGQNQSRK